MRNANANASAHAHCTIQIVVISFSFILNILLDISKKNGFDLTKMQNCLFSYSKESVYDFYIFK